MILAVTSVGYGDGISMPEGGMIPFGDNNVDFITMLLCMLFGSMIFNIPKANMFNIFNG